MSAKIPSTGSSSPIVQQKEVPSKNFSLFGLVKSVLSSAKKETSGKESFRETFFLSLAKGIQEIKKWSESLVGFSVPANIQTPQLYNRFNKINKDLTAPRFEEFKKYSLLASKDNTYIVFAPFTSGADKEICLGINVKTGESVIISKLSPKSSSRFEETRLTDANAKKLKELSKGKNEGGIVPILEVINYKKDKQEAQFVVQKWCKEGSLNDFLESNDAGSLSKKDLIADLFKGVSSLFEAGLLHTDLKPQNILIENGHAYVGDHESVQQNVPMTFCYAAPENVLGDSFAEKSLVWSLGLVLYRILTGSEAEVAIILQAMLSLVGTENIHSHCISEMQLGYFLPHLPWENENYLPKSNGEALIAKMLRANASDRCTLSEAYAAFVEIAEENLTFEPMPLSAEAEDFLAQVDSEAV